MKQSILLLLFILITFSCQKETAEPESEIEYSPEISFYISNHIFAGKNIKNIEFVNNRFYYTIDKKIILSTESGQTISSFTSESTVLAMAYNAVDGALYFGTQSSGLGKLRNNKISYYTVNNSDLPRDLIADVECDKSGNIWFNASANQVGGVVKYTGSKFHKYLPENSNLPNNLIYSIRVLEDKVFVLSKGKEAARAAIKIDGNQWTALFESGGCSPTDMDVNSKGDIFYIEDSREYCGGGLFPDEILFSYSNNQKTKLREHDTALVDMPHIVRVDKRDYVWVAKFPTAPYKSLSVYNGETWFEATEEFSSEDFIYCIEVDDDNNIWLGTNNGIFVLNQ